MIVVYNLLVFIPVGVGLFLGIVFKGLGPMPVVVGWQYSRAALTHDLPRPRAKRPGRAAELHGDRAGLCRLRRMLRLCLSNLHRTRRESRTNPRTGRPAFPRVAFSVKDSSASRAFSVLE